jgi:hypothetical protein
MDMNKLLLTTALSFAMATGASAVTVGGVATGMFTGDTAGEPVGSEPLAFGQDGAEISADQKQITWPGESCFFVCGDISGHPSSLTILDGAFEATDLSNGVHHIDLFRLKWENAATWDLTTTDEFDVYATFDVLFDTPAGGGGSENVRFRITNTDNPAGDIIDPSLQVGPLDFGGVPEPLPPTVTVLDYAFMVMGDGQFGGAGCGMGNWCVDEGGTSYLNVQAKVNVVPLPAAGWMLLAGIGGLVAMKRRRKAGTAA